MWRLGIVIALAATACQKEGAGPPADCQAVGSYAVAFTLGNYAPVEERAPAIAKMVAACRQAGVDRKQGECVMAAKDVWTAAACAPKLFPEIKVGGDCDVIARRLGEALKGQMGASDPSSVKMLERMTAAVRDSCEHDGWPAALKTCTLAAPDLLKGMDQCEKLVTPELKSKMQARMSAAVQ